MLSECHAQTPVFTTHNDCVFTRPEPRMLEQCLTILFQPKLQFRLKAISLPLLLQLGSSDIRLQRIVASLLTVQAALFPALIVPAFRKFMRTTLLRLENSFFTRCAALLSQREHREISNSPSLFSL